MSELQASTARIVSVFYEYSGKQGDPDTLTKAELKELLQSQFGDMFGNVNDKAELDKIFSDLDINGDNTVDFMEYFMMVGRLTIMINTCIQSSPK